MNLKRSCFLILAAAVGSAACSSESESNDDAAQHQALVVAVCDQYAALDAKCGYDKHPSAEACKTAMTPCSNDTLTKYRAYYDCLNQCTPGAGGSGGGASIEDLSAPCATEVFGTTSISCD